MKKDAIKSGQRESIIEDKPLPSNFLNDYFVIDEEKSQVFTTEQHTIDTGLKLELTEDSSDKVHSRTGSQMPVEPQKLLEETKE